jgi:prepilin-type N-terminal cleavage/methylation domain-containing protein
MSGVRDVTNLDDMNQRSLELSPGCAPPIGPRPGRGRSVRVFGPRRHAAPSGRRGFTLVELLVVITIIGIILSFVLIAGLEAANRANERATQSLITKLEAGLNDRIDALIQTQPIPNYAHGYLAAIYSTAAVDNNTGLNALGSMPPATLYTGATQGPNPAIKNTARAQVIATYDYIKSELPDVFSIDPTFASNSTSYTGPYPFNFTGQSYPGTSAVPNDTKGYGNYMLPLGHMVSGPYNPTKGYSGFGDSNISPGYLSSTFPNLGFIGSGIYGATYTAAAGIYKNLGYLPAGYDAVDNNGDNLVDDWTEGIGSDPLVASPDNPNIQINVSTLVRARLGNHKHNTARSEMLFALLVEGNGPLGSVFNRDEFTDKEVQDTDGDGLPEFVDAWGQPIQFFRWPLFYHSDFQRGQIIAATSGETWGFYPPYLDPVNSGNSVYQQREQDPLDPNQQLLAPGWWSATGVGGLAANNNPPVNYATGTTTFASASNGAAAFEFFFHRLTEPLEVGKNTGTEYWDRAGSYRRAFYTKFLILSAGPDRLPGVFLYADSDFASMANPSSSLISFENNAMQFGTDVFDSSHGGFIAAGTTIPANPSLDPTHPSSYDIQQAGQDDISNHNIGSTATIGGSG